MMDGVRRDDNGADADREVLELGVMGDDAPTPSPVAARRARRSRRPLVAATVACASLVLLLVVTAGGGIPTAGPTRLTGSTRSSPMPTSSSPAPSPRDTSARGMSGMLRQVTTDLHRRLLGVTVPWELFARGDDLVVRIQPALGRVTQTPLPSLRSDGPVAFLALRDRVLIRPLDLVPGYQVRDGTPAVELTGALRSGGAVFPGPDLGHVWLARGDPGSVELVLLGADDNKGGRSVPLPPEASLFALTSDGAGSVLLTGVGGAYAVRSDGLRRITMGMLLAAGPTGWLTVECDPRYRCSIILRDRSGRARAITGATFGTGSLGGYALGGVISPDGRAAAVFEPTPGPAPVLDLLQLRTGGRHRVEVDVGEGPDQGTVAWSPDSRWLFVLDAAGRLRVVDPGTGTVSQLLPDLPRPVQLSIRPAQ
jgi:hypothetical protein